MSFIGVISQIELEFAVVRDQPGISWRGDYGGVFGVSNGFMGLNHLDTAIIQVIPRG